jgi:hypothetical protein
MRVWIFLVTAALAACGSGGGGVDANGDAVVGQDGVSTDGGRIDAVANTCDQAADCDACEACTYDLGGPCKPAFNACFNLQSCLDLDGCIGACPTGDQPCVDACNAMYPDAVDEYAALFDCIACVCVTTCGEPTPPGGC